MTGSAIDMNIFDVLGRMQDALQQLDDILTQEQRELSSGQVNAAFLHRLTENKNEQLSILSHFDKQRLQIEQTLSMQAPYASHTELNAIWMAIHERTRHLSQINHRSGLLLDQHLQNTQVAIDFLEKQTQEQNVYGPDGHQQQPGSRLGRKFGV
ncbi:flagellar export chaperone FlgN [Brenneria goodwinii]|uniref:flagella synthesis protein FlgN n=1 Tax=Brenneria goodwinii TaxID=1109412 RepID=UPI0036EAB10C